MASDMSVLIAHFDAAILGSLQQWVEAAGARALTASDGPMALEIMAKERPQLALLSTLLPGTNGFEVCRQIRQGQEGRVSVVLMTDVEDPYVRARARHVGAKKVVVEPLSAETVDGLIHVAWEDVDPLGVGVETDAGGSQGPGRLLQDLLDTKESDSSSTDSLLQKLTDPLTGLVNGEYFALKLQEEFKRATRYGQPLALIVAEIGHFDSIRESFGVEAGDEALLEVAGVFLCESRDIDIAGRIRDASFQLLMPTTSREGAEILLDRIAEALVERTLSFQGKDVGLNVALGVACLEPGQKMEHAQQLIQDAEVDLGTRCGSIANPLSFATKEGR